MELYISCMYDDYFVISVIDGDSFTVYYHMCSLMDTYPILACVWCVCFLLYVISDVVKEGSCSHLLVEIYMMHHFLSFLV